MRKACAATYGCLLDSGVTILTPLGSTGEFPNLSLAEQRRVVEVVLDETRGRDAIVIAGCASNSTVELVDIARSYKDAGVDGLLAVSAAADIGLLFYYLPDWHHLDVTTPELIGLPPRTGLASGLARSTLPF